MRRVSGDEERRQVAAYEAATLALIKEITAGLGRGGRLLAQRAERRDDPAWRAEISAECRSWRRSLDALPGEPPPLYAPTHARIVRWAAAVAEAGDAYAAAIERGDGLQLLEASRKLSETPALYAEITRALSAVAAKMRE